MAFDLPNDPDHDLLPSGSLESPGIPDAGEPTGEAAVLLPSPEGAPPAADESLDGERRRSFGRRILGDRRGRTPTEPAAGGESDRRSSDRRRSGRRSWDLGDNVHTLELIQEQMKAEELLHLQSQLMWPAADTPGNSDADSPVPAGDDSPAEQTSHPDRALDAHAGQEDLPAAQTLGTEPAGYDALPAAEYADPDPAAFYPDPAVPAAEYADPDPAAYYVDPAVPAAEYADPDPAAYYADPALAADPVDPALAAYYADPDPAAYYPDPAVPAAEYADPDPAAYYVEPDPAAYEPAPYASEPVEPQRPAAPSLATPAVRRSWASRLFSRPLPAPAETAPRFWATEPPRDPGVGASPHLDQEPAPVAALPIVNVPPDLPAAAPPVLDLATDLDPIPEPLVWIPEPVASAPLAYREAMLFAPPALVHSRPARRRPLPAPVIAPVGAFEGGWAPDAWGFAATYRPRPTRAHLAVR